MPPAARVADVSNHGGMIIGPGKATVLIGGMPAAVLMDLHICVIPPIIHAPMVSPFISGSATVLIGGMPALRTTDSCLCGAMPAVGEPTVLIGG